MPQASGTTYTTPSGRTFHVYSPANYDASKTYPVVLAYHGWQTEGPDFEAWFKMEEQVNGEAFVVYPDAVNGYWDLQGDTDVTFFDDMVKMLGDTYCIDPSHIMGLGFSYGAYFMNILGCKRAGYVKAIMLGDGGWAGDGTSCGRLPVLVVVRTMDTEEPPSHGQVADRQWASLNKCTPNATQPTNTDLNCSAQMGCSSPGQLSFCTDTSSLADIPGYDPSWDHTVRPQYQAYGYQWFKALP